MNKDFTARFRVPIELWESFKELCENRGQVPSKVLRKMIEDFIKRKRP